MSFACLLCNFSDHYTDLIAVLAHGNSSGKKHITALHKRIKDQGHLKLLFQS